MFGVHVNSLDLYKMGEWPYIAIQKSTPTKIRSSALEHNSAQITQGTLLKFTVPLPLSISISFKVIYDMRARLRVSVSQKN